jgi:hypothetical protein
MRLNELDVKEEVEMRLNELDVKEEVEMRLEINLDINKSTETKCLKCFYHMYIVNIQFLI